MSEDNKARDLARRDFFKQVGLGAAVAGTTAVAVSSGASAAGEATRTGSVGYRETAHVKTYYELAKF